MKYFDKITIDAKSTEDFTKLNLLEELGELLNPGNNLAVKNSFQQHVLSKISSITRMSTNPKFFAFMDRFLALLIDWENNELSITYVRLRIVGLIYPHFFFSQVLLNLETLKLLQAILLEAIHELSILQFNLPQDFQLYERLGLLCGVLSRGVIGALRVGHHTLFQSLITGQQSNNGNKQMASNASSDTEKQVSVRLFNERSVCPSAGQRALQSFLQLYESDMLTAIGKKG